MTSNWQWDLVIALLSGVALLTGGYIYEKVAERRDKKVHPALGRIVAVGDHKLHLFYKASVGPTLVIEQGAGEPSRLWWPVQDKIAEFASVCTYDRAGYGWSEPVAAGRTIAERAEELHTLLTNAGIPGPYILVAHSYGGFIVRCFARNHPDQTAGLVLVDTPEETAFFRREVLQFYSRLKFMNEAVELAARFGVLRLLGQLFPLDQVGFSFVRPAEYSAAGDDLASLQLVEPPMGNFGGVGSLGDLPLAVITHGQPFPGPFFILEKGWSEGQTRLAALSTNSVLIRAHNSNHMIQIDEPGLVVDAIRRVHAAARNKVQLAHDGTSQELPAVRP
ncbi:MAG: alpha/beta hydrolase [Candidatus Sulfotelmatobacter sp.]|jgi:pimeloyl-ACP methyl ester carboxylesterase